jgi:general secretion pathway protein A
MYNEYFGFKEAPFSIAPDPRYLYMTSQHREALAHLVYGLNSEGGCILLTGEVGTGKTTICRCLLEQVPEQANVALVLNPKVSEIELLETICDELNISYPDTDNSVKTYTDRIYQFLIESNRKNEKTVLIIDEAQNLSSKVLEQLRLLTNLETNERKLLQIIILGQPELLDILASTEMRQLAQRITARFHLRPLTKTEVKAYVSHRLAVAGQNIQLFPENSIKLLYKLSNGVPRLINILCDRALLGAYVENHHAVPPPIIKKAAKEVFGELKNVERQHKNRQWLYPIAALSVITTIAIALFLYLTLSPVNDDSSPAPKTLSSDENSTADTTTTPLSEQNNIEQSNTDRSNLEQKDIVQNDTDNIVPASELAQSYTDDTDSQDAMLMADTSKDSVNATVPSAQADYDDIKQILNEETDNPVSAYHALFRAWKHNYNDKTATTACKQAEAFSLRCLHKQGNLNSLKTHNRPAVLKLVNDHGEIRYITITSIQGDIAIIYSNGSEHEVRLADLDRYWYGQFILLWRKPENYASAISPGDSGNIVAWLSAHFAEDRHENNNDRFYDSDLVEKVKAFQAQHGLAADGIVGPMTIIYLNTKSGMDVPTLTTTG